MSMAVKPGYVNPLTMMKQKKNGEVPKALAPQKKEDHDVKVLQTKQQSLQNEILLLKSTSDGASLSKDSQEALEQQVEEITAELKAAKSQIDSVTEDFASATSKSNFDLYKKQEEETDSPGLYQLQRDEEEGYKISFTPFSERSRTQI